MFAELRREIVLVTIAISAFSNMDTIKTTCIEEPKLCYNDGVNIIYFNACSNIGGDDDLKRFLKYIEESKSENAVDEIINEIDGYVKNVKKKGGGEYMTLGDWVDGIVERAVKKQ